MNHANNPQFKDALELFCTEWDIDYAVLLLPNVSGDVELMGINLKHQQIRKLMAAVLKSMPEHDKARLNS